jgi:ring-1,2-phenylacetyl-CoA epoxidase subunit PaaD
LDKSPRLIPTVNPAYAERHAFRKQSQYQEVWNILDNVFDPELPGLTIWDLGVLQNVEQVDDDIWRITITPTYSGCPAVDAMSDDIKSELNRAGYDKVIVKVALAPAWTTDMISPKGAAHLKSIQIAPPIDNEEEVNPSCPLCDSSNTVLISQFGSTACKALYQCQDCHEPFDYFKTL